MAKACPKCGSSDVVPTVYPFPDEKTKMMVEKGQRIASCDPGVVYGCRKCGHTW